MVAWIMSITVIRLAVEKGESSVAAMVKLSKSGRNRGNISTLSSVKLLRTSSQKSSWNALLTSSSLVSLTGRAISCSIRSATYAAWSTVYQPPPVNASCSRSLLAEVLPSSWQPRVCVIQSALPVGSSSSYRYTSMVLWNIGLLIHLSVARLVHRPMEKLGWLLHPQVPRPRSPWGRPLSSNASQAGRLLLVLQPSSLVTWM